MKSQFNYTRIQHGTINKVVACLVSLKVAFVQEFSMYVCVSTLELLITSDMNPIWLVKEIIQWCQLLLKATVTQERWIRTKWQQLYLSKENNWYTHHSVWAKKEKIHSYRFVFQAVLKYSWREPGWVGCWVSYTSPNMLATLHANIAIVD